MAFESICELLDRVGLDAHPSIAEHYQVQVVEFEYLLYEPVGVIHMMRHLRCAHQCRCTFEMMYTRTIRHMAELDRQECERQQRWMYPDKGYDSGSDDSDSSDDMGSYDSGIDDSDA